MHNKKFALTPLAIAMRLACAAMVLAPFTLPAHAQTAPARQAYDIPAGNLGEALNRFAQQAGVAIVFDSARVQGLKTSGLRGSYGVDEGFSLLLQGSGYAIGKNAAGYILVPAPVGTQGSTTLPEVAVTATAVDNISLHLQNKVSAGALGSRSQLETPLSTTVITREDLSERQISKLGDVFALDAAVTDTGGSNTSWASYMMVRGLELDWQSAYRINGTPFMSYAITLPYEHFEQIDLLKGASGFMYGFGSPGGLINYTTKRPTEETTRSIEVGYKSNSIWTESVDLGGRFGENKMFGYRLNAVNERGKAYNDGLVDRQSISLGLDARLTQDLTWYFDSLYQKRNTENQTTAIYVTGTALPSAIRDDSQRLNSKGKFLHTDFEFYSTGLKYQLAPEWLASVNYSQSFSKRNRNEGTLFLTNAAGDYTENRSHTTESHRFDQMQALLEGKARTGSIEHQLVFGAAWQKQYNNYSVYAANALGGGNIFSQNNNSFYSTGELPALPSGEVTQRAVFASDTLKLSERWSVLGGLRYTKYEQSGGVYSEDIVTPTAALMYKLEPTTMLYTSYMESLEPGRVVGATYANRNALLKPLVSKQYEVGIKSEHARWSGTAALFRIERPSEYEKPAAVPGDPGTLVQDGESSYQGLELGATGKVGTQWQLSGNLMWLDATYDKGPDNIGNRVAGTPELMATTRVVYTVPGVAGLKLMADAKYTGDTQLNAGNTIKVGSYTLLNMGAIYSVNLGGYATTFRASVNNVTNEKYWAFQYENYIRPADPRTFSLSARVDF
jgi:iron complex outermembrane receptor protein